MAIYDVFMQPLEKMELGSLRKKLIKKASGQVLEIGPGTGLNLPYYDAAAVDRLILADQDLKPRVLKKKIKKHPQLTIELSEEDVMDLPFTENQFDTVVFTLVFCTVSDAQKGLTEIKRVLKEEGKIIFIEHVRPKKEPLKKTFDLLTPVWKKMANGCHLNRKTIEVLETMGFDLELEGKGRNNIFVGGTGKIKKTAR